MTDSKEKIINAAIEVFAEKGKYGTHMEEIAAKAGVNKAMAYYYFSTKENLYKEAIQKVLLSEFILMVNEINLIMSQAISPKEKLTNIIKTHFAMAAQNQDSIKIMVGALVNNPEYIHEVMLNKLEQPHSDMHNAIDIVLKEGIEAGIFRNIDPMQTQISILGIIFMFFIGRPIGQAMLDCPCEDEGQFLEQRLNSVIDLVLNGIAVKA